MAALGWLLNLGFAASEGASAALTGTITSADESDIVAGGRTIILTLTGDTWVAAGASFDGARQSIIDGLTSAGAEATGWNAEVRDKEVVTAVVRTSDTVVTITLSAASAYAITADETITATIPSGALVSEVERVATPTFTVTNLAEATPEPTGDGGGGGEYRGRRRRPEASRKSTGGAYGPVFEEPPARVTRKSPVRPLAGSTSSREHLAALRERARELENAGAKSQELRQILDAIEAQVKAIEQAREDDDALLLLLVAME